MWLCYCAAAVFKIRISNKVESGTAELGDFNFVRIVVCFVLV